LRSRRKLRKETKEETAMMKDGKTSKREPALGRRDFLRTLGGGATVAAAAGAPLAGDAHADTESNDEKRKSRYRETDHVKTFYRVNRYPG
jgi:hypothetical protein